MASLDDVVAAAREVRAVTGGTVLVSLGADGALLLSPAGGWYAEAPSIAPVNTTGAGDALLAGYLVDDTAEPPAAGVRRLDRCLRLPGQGDRGPADVLVDLAGVRVRPSDRLTPAAGGADINRASDVTVRAARLPFLPYMTATKVAKR